MRKLLLLFFTFYSLLTFGQATFTNSAGTWSYNQNFNTLTGASGTAWSNNTTIVGWYSEKNSAGAIATYGPNTGSTTTAGLYSYGSTSSTDRAIGVAMSNTFAPTPGGVSHGLRLQNNTGSTIYSLTISYNGEQWRRDNTAAQKLTFAYKTGTSLTTVGTTDLTTGGFTALTSLDFTSPITTTGGALDGNLTANRTQFTNILIVLPTPIAANEEVMLKWFDANDSGNDHVLAIDDINVVAGLTPIPTLLSNISSISNINYLAGSGPSGSASFTISGTNLSPAADNITVTAPTNFEVSTTSGGTYSDNLLIPYTSGAITSTPIFVRLKAGLTAGSYGGAGTYVVSSGGSASVSVSVAGVVQTGTECGTATNISDVRATIPVQAAYTGTTTYTISGTVTGVFGSNKFYVSDASGGIAVFTTNIVTNNRIEVGDLVRLTGTPARFNGEAELLTVTCIAKISSGTAPSPIIFDTNSPPSGITLNDFLLTNEGNLIKIVSSNLNASGTFSTGLNFAILTCNNQGGSEIRIDATATTFSGYPIPSVTQDITGVVGHYITSNGGTDKLQIYPRNASDLTNSTITCPISSGGVGGCGVATITDNPLQLDVVAWNVEWLGHPANGPSQSGTNDATQIANAKTVLNSIGADVYMLEEICSYNAADPTDVTTAFGQLLAGLNTTFGANSYSGECSPAVSGSVVDANPQRVCIIYKNSVVTKINSKVMFENYTPATYPPTGTPSQFWASGRKPFIFKAQVSLNGVVDTLNFVGLHAKSGSDATSYARRSYDVREMYDTLQTQYPNQKIIIGGDLNDDLDVSIYPNNISSYKPFLYANPDETSITGTRPSPSFDPVTKSLSDIGCASTASYPDVIDHIIVSNEVTSNSPKFNFVAGSPSNLRPYSLVSNYSATTSDHFPLLVRFSSQACPSKPAITASSLNICGSGSVTLSASACTNGTLKWTGGLAGTSITVSPTTTSQYKVACTIVDCTSDSSEVVTITVNPIPTKPDISPLNSTICSGSSASLTASACVGGTLNWTDGLVGTSISVSPTSSKGYKVACTINGCTSDSSEVVTITVNPIPSKPTISPASSAICIGNSISLTASACVGGTLNWTDGLMGTSISVSPSATKSYKVACTINNCTSDSSDVITITVNVIPTKPTISPLNSTICSGSSVSLTASACMGGTLNWTDGLLGTSISVSPLATKSYKVACTINACTSDSSDVVTITVKPIPSKPTIMPTSAIICQDGSVTLVSTSCMSGVLKWTDGASGSSITVSPSATKEYRVACTINDCTSDSSNATLVTVKPKPSKPTVSANNTTICIGNSTSLTSSACSGGILNWTDGLLGTSISVSPTSTKGYRVSCTINDCTSDSSDVVQIIVNPLPPAPTLSANPQTIIIGQSSQLSATGCDGGTITWSLGNATTNPLSVSPTQNTTYAATCTSLGCMSVPATITVNVTSNQPCQSLVNLVSTTDDYATGIQLKDASATNGKIAATNKISGSANVIYQAKVIELNAGFKADSGTVFTAQIGGCN